MSSMYNVCVAGGASRAPKDGRTYRPWRPVQELPPV